MANVVEVNGHDSHGARFFGGSGYIWSTDSPATPTAVDAPRTAAPTPAAESVVSGSGVEHFLSGEFVGDVNVGLLASAGEGQAFGGELGVHVGLHQLQVN